jgi:hypothetical protein
MSRMRLWGAVGAIAAGTMVLCGCASTETRAGADQLGVIDTRATDSLKRMTDFLAAQPRVKFDLTVFYDDYAAGDMKVQFARHVGVAIERPNHAAGVSDGDKNRRRFWYDGSHVTMLDETGKTYAQYEVPNTFDDMVETMAEEYDTPLPVAEFLTAGAYERLMDGVKTALYVGEHHVIDEELCEHLVFEDTDRDWQVWIKTGDQPLLQKLVIAYKTMPNCPQYVAIFRHWDLAPTFGTGDFTPKIPDNAIQVERLESRMPKSNSKS